MSDNSEEELNYLAENADRIVPYYPPGYFARIQAQALTDRERKKKEEKTEDQEKTNEKNGEEKNDEEENENYYDKDGNLVPRVGPKTLALYYDEETGGYVGEVIAKVEQQQQEEEEIKEQTKLPSSQPAPERKPRTNLSLLKPIPAFPGYKNPDLRNEDWALPIDQVDWKARLYREVMRYREIDEWNRSQYKLAVKDCKKAWKTASRRLKKGRGVVMAEVVQKPDQLET
ncbi:hypothetical protein CKAH01_09835 [Colletotrichum kahawae]|uniref:Uncharacterized protein n=1 Tax=Colletotrichum kahawae TaxID=34407 RepID=A0AAD9Y043_COLKA|nr:hypothetical protein CKAH01_09835 [Colletotrichum kahawae]